MTEPIRNALLIVAVVLAVAAICLGLFDISNRRRRR